MARWLKINGTDYNLDVVGALSFTDFKLAGENSFSKGIADDHLKQIHKTLTAAAAGKTELQENKQPEPLAENEGPKNIEPAPASLQPVQVGDKVVMAKPENEGTDGKSATDKKEGAAGKGKRTGVGKG